MAPEVFLEKFLPRPNETAPFDEDFLNLYLDEMVNSFTPLLKSKEEKWYRPFVSSDLHHGVDAISCLI